MEGSNPEQDCERIRVPGLYRTPQVAWESSFTF